MSCRTKATRSSGVRVSSTPSSARPTVGLRVEAGEFFEDPEGLSSTGPLGV
jgi:hypothetical protein